MPSDKPIENESTNSLSAGFWLFSGMMVAAIISFVGVATAFAL